MQPSIQTIPTKLFILLTTYFQTAAGNKLLLRSVHRQVLLLLLQLEGHLNQPDLERNQLKSQILKSYGWIGSSAVT